MTSRTLKIGSGLELPLETATAALALVGQRGAGKTHGASVLAEELIGVGVPVAVLDPLGVLWGLRSSADGKHAGLAVVILGGEHGDVPLEPTSGKVIADWLTEERRSAVLDLSGFRKAEQHRFATDFAEELYRKNRDPLHVVVDEADFFMPQRPMPGEQRMLGAFEDLVRRGRARGLGITIATQRPAVVHKDCLTQVAVLIALRLAGPQDRKAIEEWIRYHGGEDERRIVLESLPKLPIGSAWFWSPGWLQILQKVQIRQRRTFDSSATPKVGKERIAPSKLAPVDLDALTSKIAATIERAKQDDPKVLRKRIAELERELTSRPSAEPEMIDRAVFDRKGIDALREVLRKHVEYNEIGIRDLYAKVDRALVAYSEGCEAQERGASRLRTVIEPARTAAREVRPTNGASSGLNKCERALLTAWAQHGRLSLIQASIIAGYSTASSTPFNAASKLRTSGFIEGGNESAEITSLGRKTLGNYTPLPTGPALAEYWLARLNKCESAILNEIIGHYPKRVSIQQAADATGYSTGSSTPFNAASKLRTLALVHGGNSGMVADERLVS
jgi:hypothetical protein